ncbi:hypothetical protein Aeh1ORF287c [Aeromonas phage Aeh1]|uniref:Uncharacterized protein n=1 Tax=Aeromonas phage Aeh1 TaxID=2880362 RepID=Q76YD9_9CAUD|nr:virion structural protein [Aeromonas phage Aeh1]AAQ17956.1 hypothetical protein Aeh1ORF287c [Aeromonas phage Aeh1]
MNKTVIAVVVLLLGLIVVPVMGFVGMYVSTSNTNTQFESNIEKFHKASQNTLSNYTLKIRDMAQIPEMYTADLKKVIDATFQGRYGKDGSKAVTQFMTENNLQFDSSMYKSLQVAMEAGRNEFKLSQDKKLDVCAGYENQRNFVMSGFFSRMAGFPKKDVDSLCKIVLDKETNKAFETGEAETIKLR